MQAVFSPAFAAIEAEELKAFMGPFPNEITGDEARAWSESASDVDPESLKWIQDFLGSNVDMKFN